MRKQKPDRCGNPAGIKIIRGYRYFKPDAFIPPRDDELDDIMEILSVNWGSRMLPLSRPGARELLV